MNIGRRHVQTLLSGLAVSALCGGLFAAWYVYEPALDRISRPERSAFDMGTVKKGEQLATVGDCIVCHTAGNGPPFAGSRPLPTPFGTLYSTNITPDERTGIGNWSQEAFARALKQGVSRDGSHLYPALPYEHFTHVTDDDIRSLYAFLMTRQAVVADVPENKLLPGLGFRPLLAGWKMLFLHRGGFAPLAGKTEAWNRGKYLVDGLAHCGGCHTPRNIAGGEKRGSEFAGGLAEGWIAPPLDRSNPSAGRWTEASLFAYLKNADNGSHGIAGGPMGPVAEGLSKLDDADVSAIALYIASVMGREGATPDDGPAIDNAQSASTKHPEGADLFRGACAACHEPGSAMSQQGRLPLSALTSVRMADPANAASAVMMGIPAPSGGGNLMPSFSSAMSESQVADLLQYVRARFTNGSPWKDTEGAASSARPEDER